MPMVILDDPTYPLLLWLMKLYTGILHCRKEQFNYRLNKCRMMTMCFWTFKGKILQSTNKVKPQRMQHFHGGGNLLCAPLYL